MTYVEFFAKTASENICACLTYAPDRVVYIGDNAKLMRRHIERYQRVFTDRGIEIEFQCRTVSRYSLESAVELLSEIVDTYDDYVFDIAGGDEIILVALGIVCERRRDRNIQIHRFNLRNNVIYDCDQDGVTIYRDPPALTVEENIRIYGGDVVYGGISENKTYKWDVSPDLIRDVDNIWSVCAKNTRAWNVQTGIFSAAEAAGSISADGLTTVVSINRMEDSLGRSFKADWTIINGLFDCGVITQFGDDGYNLTISYKNEQVKKCLTKSGQALEMKVFLTAGRLTDKSGCPVYNDIQTGVLIDWDSVLHDEQTDGIYDTENEMDVLMMHGMVPVFVSCKNGLFTAEELYKLNTVAERFGGQYAKKVLVTTAISTMGESGKYLLQRAEDLKIQVVANLQDMSESEISKALRNLWC